MLRTGCYLLAWHQPCFHGLSSSEALEIPLRTIREWAEAPSEPAAPEVVEETAKAPVKGKKPTTPALEQPRAPGPPEAVLRTSIEWLTAAVKSSHAAAATVAELPADRFIALLRHPSPSVLDASLKLFTALSRNGLLLKALLIVRSAMCL